MEASQTPAARALGTLRSTGLVGLLVVALGVAGAVFLVVAELSTIILIEVDNAGTCEEIAAATEGDECQATGIERHGGALFLLAGLALAMTTAAGCFTSRPAAAALVMIGLVVGGLTVRDFADSDQTGLVGITYEQAEAGLEQGFTLEVIGAVLCVAAGALRLARREA